jgi:hypothetical protein
MNKRRQAKETGVHLPTQKEKRAAAREARLRKDPITVDDVNQLVEDTPVTEQEARVNNPTLTKFETAQGIKHPVHYRMNHANIDQTQR